MRKRGEEHKRDIRNRKGQVTVFIIIAIIVVAFAFLIYFYYPRIQSFFVEATPEQEIYNCMNENGLLEETIEKVSLQGGSINPSNYFTYNDNKIEYLCYTNEFYKTCVMQQPLLKQHIESEIERQIKFKERECFEKLKSNYESKGYNVNLKYGNMSVELLPKKIMIRFNNQLSISKGGESSGSWKKIDIFVNNNLYELVLVSTSILNWEARYGDSETTLYMTYYPGIKAEKLLQQDGTKIYILSEREKENKFQFATRSVVYPPGY